ncbi:cryptochrome 2 isoform X1 [Solanum lycopersicum]|uniref:Cryptochrome 2 n=1 Tax=Solanum lycopersicum TaxID=4081 RepID=Q9LDJ5_SOLLC|nr:cryptochrome 2 [Solanum lycopersicum]XP_010326737.1 cryptochrome 2 isoform X1 [Solanum lycopersicum]AAF72556.1 cryptochrome 2 [Solanum lycopersicum]AAF72557.1 cryptochrome 2 [Solanum lycopersicum]
MESNYKTIVWFRRDLRIEDNPALAAAARNGSVLPVFIWCPKEEGQFYPGRVSRWWLKQSLIHLKQSLKSLGAELVLMKAQSTLSALTECVDAVGATKVVYNHLYDPVSLVRDHNIKQKLGDLGISVQSYNGDLLNEPWEVYDDDGKVFTTFDAYWEKSLSIQNEPVSQLPPWRLTQAAGSVKMCSVEELGLENESEKSSNALLGKGWAPGWSNADKALTEFVESNLLAYSKDRLRVGGNSTSLLSPYLHFGEVSVRKVFNSVRLKQILWTKEGNSVGKDSATIYLRAIGLREYSRYICFNFPFTHERSLLNNLRFFPWNADQAHFKAWRQGRTGYPLVDAGMRELWATGWVHNKIRVIVSSFFVKFLLLPWQWGMKYFWDTLLDADLESDIIGWQYISGSLPDGHELERLDNPEVQGFNYDPEGEYVRHWLPELARMPAEWIHHPWDAPLNVLKAAGVELGMNYPNPIIDVDVARDRLMQAIIIMREKEAAVNTSHANGTVEVVFDNSENVGDSASIPKDDVVKGKEPCPSSSSYDQRVPSMQNVGTYRKRPKPEEETKKLNDNKLSYKNERIKMSNVDGDLCSTAESSSMKKQMTVSRNSFSVPRTITMSHDRKSFDDEASSHVKLQKEEEIDT